MRAALLAFAIALAGCSPLARVAVNATSIQNEAQALIDRGQKTKDEEVIRRAQTIYDLSSEIHSQLPGLEDKTPVWVSMLWWLAVAGTLCAVAFILWQTGVGTAIRIAIGWLPRRKVQDADLAVTMLDPDKPENAREYIAAKRAADPEWDAAFRRAQRENKGKP